MTAVTPVEAALTGTVPSPITPEPADVPRSVDRRSFDDWTALLGAAASSLALVWLLYTQIFPTSGIVGFVACWYIAFLGLYVLVSSLHHPRPIVLDRFVAALVAGAAVLVGAALLWTVISVFIKGWPAYHHLNFFTHDMSGVRPQDPYNKGGILHAIVGSLIEISIAVAVSLPLGIGAAVYMTEVGGRFSLIVRTVVEAMTALPDLVAGLFIYSFLIVALGYSRTGLAAALALSITMLPIIARSSEVVLRVVPGGLREAGYALGASKWQTVRRIVLPTARPGLATALILGIARGIGETAPVLIVSGATTFFNKNPLTNPMNSLPLFAFTGVRDPNHEYVVRGYAAASVLLAIVLVLFIFIRVLARNRTAKR
jgi:phosphate transport system permease protein